MFNDEFAGLPFMNHWLYGSICRVHIAPIVLAAGLMGGATVGAAALNKGGGGGGGYSEIPLTETQKKAEKYLGDLLDGKETFDPRKIAEFPPAMQEAIALVERIMSGGIPEIDQAIQATANRMTAPPEQVPGLEGLFDKTKEMGADLLGRTQRGLALTGNLPSESSAGEKIYGRTLQDIMNEFITSAYPFYAQGLQAKIDAPMQLANLGTQKVTTPLSLATTVGGMEMGREQSVFDAILEATRKTQEFPYGPQANVAGTILREPMYAYNPGQQQPSTFSQIAQPLAMLGAASIMSGGGGGGGTPANYNQLSPYQQQLFRSTATIPR